MKEIGEYFGLEVTTGNEYYPNALSFDFARSALRYLIRLYKITEIYIPYYTCYVVWKAIMDEGAKVKFYHINENLLPNTSLPKNAFILYTDYFGTSFQNTLQMAETYPNLIIDNAQSFFAMHTGLASFNSARKFMGVPDGSYLFTDKKLSENIPIDDTSWLRASHLLKKIDMGTDSAYAEFQEHDNPPPTKNIKLMSKLTKKLLSAVDYENIKTKRHNNFNYLNNFLGKKNLLHISLNILDETPMIYPLLVENGKEIRKKLFNNKIYTAVYFGNYPPNYFESYLSQNLIPLPIDQRYNETDMDFIIKTLNK